jgi:hypothetical protein
MDERVFGLMGGIDAGKRLFRDSQQLSLHVEPAPKALQSRIGLDRLGEQSVFIFLYLYLCLKYIFISHTSHKSSLMNSLVIPR